MSRSVLAVDIGSSALKAVLIGEDGTTRASSSAPIVTATGADGTRTQSPDDWWQAFRSAVASLEHRDSAEAIVFAGSMQNFIPLSRDGHALAPAVLYSDRRLDEDTLTALERRLPGDYAERVGNRLDPAHTILKLMCFDRFLGKRAPADDVRFLFGAKDAITFRVTGRAAIDPTVASTTGLMNLKSRTWDPGLLDVAEVDAACLPDILPADAILGALSKTIADDLGLSAGIAVFNGAGDAAAATWGAAADTPGHAYAYLGTTGWVAATVAMADAAAPRDIYTLADPIHADRAIIISPFLTAGSAIDWLAEVAGSDVETLLETADGLGDPTGLPLFLPYLSGER